ncbi:hypothetical protein BDV34DRAFT_162700 [Aspergillus parasiticus]|uniref:Uncharacterized protein n=2 Tax=Aspergillus subgen. Circumdati TaxID=2720871 RepID=A0A5N6D9D9_ASPPA|nr:hypothetical protein BDV34DRAFT_162700 [Aspergillus parasiticus]KAE8309219.1 hypothetical protein BDV41DRAFT_439588 [Aspergillus transmontanensis]
MSVFTDTLTAHIMGFAWCYAFVVSIDICLEGYIVSSVIGDIYLLNLGQHYYSALYLLLSRLGLL